MSSLLALFAHALPIWHAGNLSTNCSYFLSPPFVLPAPVSSFTSLPLLFSAMRSPQVSPVGTRQSKLFNAATLYLNGVPLTAGPGHATLDSTQPVRLLDLVGLPLLDPPSANVIAVSSCFFSHWGSVSDPSLPRLQLLVASIGSANSTPTPVLSTGTSWAALDTDLIYNPSGDVNSKSPKPWYHQRQENVNASAYPAGWNLPGYDPGSAWTQALVQPPFPQALALETAPVPALLSRTACSVTLLPTGSQLLDYGQEMLGGPNLTFARSPGDPPVTFTVKMGEELTAPPSPPGVLAPCRSSVNYTFTWTVPGGLTAGMHATEFLQFRYVELGVGAPAITPAGAAAWVLASPRGGDGSNPYEQACARSRPLTPGRSPPPPSPALPASTAHASFASSSPALDAVFAFCAYTATATSLDINVDSQTRQRDLCHVDAYITAAAQYAVFPANDASVQARTARAAFQLSSSILPATLDFKASTVLLAGLVQQEAGDGSVWGDVWASSDAAVEADGGQGYLSAQLLSGIRYYNASLGLLAIPPACGPGATWGCDALIDWPVQTRDGYVLSPVDTLRNSYGAAAIRALAGGAAALGQAQAAARYSATAQAIAAALGQRMLRWNGSGLAYFADGLQGSAGGGHGAVHSTVYAIALGGVLQAWNASGSGGASLQQLAQALTAYLRQRGGYGPASCMTAKVVIEALYALGVHCSDAADFALELLSRSEYPSWGAMLAVNATTTLEAWLPGDKCEFASLCARARTHAHTQHSLC